ncbi:hypothetical protein U9M48_026880, partial [Paspalum notatum var. saurae]
FLIHSFIHPCCLRRSYPLVLFLLHRSLLSPSYIQSLKPWRRRMRQATSCRLLRVEAPLSKL